MGFLARAHPPTSPINPLTQPFDIYRIKQSMLRIRFSRTGKAGQPSYRIVVAERSAPVKGRSVEVLGHYMPARNPKVFAIEKDRVTYWVSKGAIPTSSVASLLKKQGFSDMERYQSPAKRQRKKKGEQAEAAKPAAPSAPAAPAAAAPAAPAA